MANDGKQSQGDQGVDILGIRVSVGGRVVVFASDALNLLPNDTNRSADIFVVRATF